MKYIKLINERLYHDVDDINSDDREYTPNGNVFNIIKDRLLPNFLIYDDIPDKGILEILNFAESDDFYIDIHPLDDEYFDIEYLDTRDKSYGKTMFNSVFYRCDGIEGLIEFLTDEKIIKPNIKLFEAFSKDHYKKALNNIKELISKDTPKEDILKYIDKFNINQAEKLDQLRIIIERVQREFNNTYSRHVFYNRTTKSSKKRKDGSNWEKSWKAGETVITNKFDTKKYYVFDSSTINQAKSFLEYNKNLYINIVRELEGFDLNRIEFFCNRFFEILEWCIETGITKRDIINQHNTTDEQKISELEELNEFDMENEVEEINKLCSRIKKDISDLYNTTI